MIIHQTADWTFLAFHSGLVIFHGSPSPLFLRVVGPRKRKCLYLKNLFPENLYLAEKPVSEKPVTEKNVFENLFLKKPVF